MVGYADEALKLDPGKRAIEANRATALLLSGRAAEAKAVYEALKKVPHPRDATLTWIDVKDDLARLAASARRLLPKRTWSRVARELGILPRVAPRGQAAAAPAAAGRTSVQSVVQ